MFGLGGGAQLGIGIAVSMNDQFSRQARAVSASMQTMREQNNQLVKQAAMDYQQMATRVAAVGAGISYGMMQAVKSGASFQQQIQKVAIVAEGKLGRSQLLDMSRKMSQEFRIMPMEVAGALFENVKAGVTDNIDLITRYQLAVSKATGEMLEGQDGVAKGLLNITNSLQINYSNFAAVANAVTVAANQTMASVNSLTEGMAYSSNDFFQLYGGKTQESRIDAMSKNLAALGMLSQMGIEGSSAGVAVSNLLRYATTGSGAFVTKKQTKALGMMGLNPGDLRDSKGNMMDMLQMLDLFAQRTKNLSSGDQLDALFGLLGVRGKKGGVNLMGADGRGVTTRGLYEQIKAGIKKDIAMNQAKQMMDTLQGDFDLAKAKWAQFLIDFTTAVEPLLRKAIPMIAKLIGGLSSFVKTGVGGMVAKVAIVAAPVITALFAFRAAVLAATFAIGGLGSAGKFSTVSRGLMATMGMSRLAGSGIVQNAAGRYMVAAGRTLDFGGKLYKGGQLLPRAALGLSSATGIAGMIGASGMMAGMGIGRVLGFLGGPWGIGITLALSFLPEIFDLLNKENDKKDMTLKGYLPNSFNSYLPGYDKERVDALNRLGLGDMANQELKQKIEIFVNGDLQSSSMNNYSVQEQSDILNQVNVDF